ncbi:MAG: hypothetical protein WAL75_12270 [Terracidiphilus sp.]
MQKPTGGLKDFRLIPRLENYPQVVSFVQTGSGKVTIIVFFSLCLLVFLRDPLLDAGYALAYGLITFKPEYRRWLIAAFPLILVVYSNYHEPLLIAASFLTMGLGMALYWCAMRWPKSLFGRRPLIFLLSGLALLMVLARQVTATAQIGQMLWALVSAAASYVWFIAYAITDRSSNMRRDGTLEFATFHPFWGSTNTPYPKGAAYLRRIEAKNGEQLAISQLKGLKLLVWAIMLTILQGLWYGFFHHYLGIPLPDQAMAMSVRGTPVAWHLRWASQLLAYFELIMAFTILGHQYIACARMAGFKALRNTYRPLSSTTVMEFFNRFYYYFKELLVDFFFYPAFLRYWKGHKRIRLIFATFAAAFFGNSIYHLLRDWQVVRDHGIWTAISSYQVLFFYNAFLAAGLCVSQLRKRDSKPAGFVRGRLLPALGVGFFYCILNVFDADERAYPLVEHLRYLASLFFIHF